MSEGYGPDERWLLSDGAIIGKIRKAPNKNGTVRLSLTMPWGDDLVVDVEKLNAASMQSFCEMAREHNNERKAEQAAKALRRTHRREAEQGEPGGGGPRPEGTVQDVQASVALNPLDAQSIARRLLEVDAEIFKLEGLRRERKKLVKILEILDAPEDDEAQYTGVPAQEGSGDQQAVDNDPRPEAVLEDREAPTDGSDSGQSSTTKCGVDPSDYRVPERWPEEVLTAYKDNLNVIGDVRGKS